LNRPRTGATTTPERPSAPPGQHEQGQGAGPEDDGAGADSEHSAGGRCGDELHRRIADSRLCGENSRYVRTQSEVGAVAERDDSRVAYDQIERQGIEDVDQDARPEGKILRQQEKSRNGDDPRQELDPADARIGAVASGVSAHACRPNRPAGRHRRIAIVAT
jgi:hypothetical protein